MLDWGFITYHVPVWGLTWEKALRQLLPSKIFRSKLWQLMPWLLCHKVNTMAADALTCVSPGQCHDCWCLGSCVARPSTWELALKAFILQSIPWVLMPWFLAHCVAGSSTAKFFYVFSEKFKRLRFHDILGGCLYPVWQVKWCPGFWSHCHYT